MGALIVKEEMSSYIMEEIISYGVGLELKFVSMELGFLTNVHVIPRSKGSSVE